MNRTPIELTFYDDNGEVIKTYRKSKIGWGFWKKANSLKEIISDDMSEDNLKIIREFVVDYFEGAFTLEDLEKYGDVADTILVCIQIANRVLMIKTEQGVDDIENPPTAAVQ